jgi:WhiB family transcriptional regulator, redox-sensing transcriptional regulator
LCRKITWAEIDWKKANCRGIATDLFFEEEDALYDRQVERAQVRKVCFRCPIRQECLMWAYADRDRWAMMGGVTARERRIIEKGNTHDVQLSALKRSLDQAGIPFTDVIEASLVERVRDEYTHTDRG